jgi:DNA-binding MarR family transcriptional regulator
MSTPTTQHIGYALKRAQHALRQTIDDSLRPLGLTTPQYAALAVVEEAPGGSGAELARRCFVTPQTMNEIVRGLLDRSLLVRGGSPRGARDIPLSLSPKGRALLNGAHQVVDEVEERMLESLTQSARHSLLSVLRRCAEALERPSPSKNKISR